MRDAGYATGAFIGAWVLESRWGLAQGFQHYDDRFQLSKYKIVSLGTVQKPGDEVMDGALAWLEGAKSGRYFAWIHLYDPHAPYEPPEPFATRYPRNPYLGEIAYTDQVVGRLMAWLQDRGQLERTIVVVTADHGEGLGDHGEAAHAFFIYGSTTHVPLIVRTPWGWRPASGTCVGRGPHADRARPGRTAATAGSRRAQPGPPHVRSEGPPGPAAYSETYFPRYHYGWQQLRAMRDERYAYVDAPEPSCTTCRPTPARPPTCTRPSARAPSRCGWRWRPWRRRGARRARNAARWTRRRCSAWRRSATSAT
jgi:hypothetical protein